ncbi:MAG: hypothetical protein HND50_13930 [Calditrichaeota bacterium]|nr:hypothetical protein [Calditrichota bacterium]
MKTFAIIFLLATNIFSQNEVSAQEALFKHKQKLWQHSRSLNRTSTSDNPQNKYDALYYKLELDIQFNPKLLSGKVTGRFQSNTNVLDTLVLDLDNAMHITSVSGPVKSYHHSNQKIEIELSQSLLLGDIIEIKIEYTGIPDSGNDRWFVFDQLIDGSPHVWTLSEPYGAKYWWPCKDFPADKADSVDIIVTVPQDQIVASNGTLQFDIIAGEKRTFHWQEKYPIATYLVSLAIGPYAHFTDSYTLPDNSSMLLDYYVYPQFEETARAVFPNVKNHLDALTFYFGSYPFSDEKYGMAQFGWGGAMEHQTISSIGNVRESWEYVYVHELGHQWFGDALTCASWTDIWLNEGFASYSEALYAEWAGFQGLEPGFDSYKSYMGTQKYLGDGALTISDTSVVSNIFDRIVYDKGSWVLHMLRYVLGDEAFFESLRTYVSELKYTSVRTEDFKNVCETISGKELDAFFDQWLNYPFFPRYAFSWEQASSEEKKSLIQITILQEQSYPVYEMPIDLQFIFPSGNDTVIQILNNRVEQIYMMEFSEVPLSVNFDPDGWVLKSVQDESGGSYSSEIKIENIYPNPSNSDVTIVAKYWGQGNLELQVFDYLGREIKKLKPFYASTIHKYYYKWDGLDEHGNRVADGIYFVSPIVKNKAVSSGRKIVIIK